MAKALRDEDLRLNIIINGDAGRKSIEDLKRSTHDGKIALDALIASQKQLEAQGKKNTPEYRALTAEIDKQSKALDDQKTRLQNLIRQQSLEKMTLRELQQHHRTTMNAFRNAVPHTEQWEKLRMELRQVDVRIKALKGSARDTGNVVQRMAGGFSKFFGAITAGFASMSFAVMGTKKARAAFLEYDEALTDAQKTTSTTKTEIREVSEELKKIDTRTTHNSLLDIVRVAGKLGIEGKQNLLEFARAGDKIGVSLARDLGGNVEAAIQQIGKLVDIFHLREQYGIEQSMLKVGSAINEIGMASTAAEGFVVDFAKRAAGTAPNVNISIQSVLGLAGTLDKLGQQAETAGTSYGQVITAMYKRTEVFAKIAKMSLGEFQKLMGEDMNEAFIRVLEGMGKSGQGMQSIVNALNSMKLDGQRSVQVLGVLAANTDELRRQQEIANRAFETGTSVIEEFNTKNESATAQYEKQKKALHEQAVILGETLNPAFTSTTSITVTFLKALTGLVKFLYQTKGAIIPIVAAVAAYKTIMFAAHKAMVIYRAAHIAYIAITKQATLVTQVFNSVVKAGPWGWIATAISVAIGAVTLFSDKIFKTHEQVRNIAAEAAVEIDNEKRKLNELQDAATRAASGSRERAEAIMIINERYGKYLPKLLTEKSTNEDIAIALQSVNTELEKNIKLKFRQQEAERIAGDEMTATKKAIAEITTKYKEWGDESSLTADKQRLIAAAVVDFTGKIKAAGDDSAKQRQAVYDLNKELQNLGMNFSGSRWNPHGRYTAIRKITTELSNTVNEGQQALSMLDTIYGKVEAPLDLNTTTTTNTTPTDPDDTGKWSLEKDKEFLTAKLKLKEKYQNGEIVSASQFNEELLKLEIAALEKRLAKNIDEGATRLEQKKAAAAKEEEINKLLQQSETDRIKRENADYELKKKRYAGNAAALEALEKTHQRNITKIRLDEIDDRLKREEETYELQKKQLKNRHKQELLDFQGSAAERKQLRKAQAEEESRLELEHLTQLSAQLKTLIESGMFDGIQLDTQLLSAQEKQNLVNRFEDVRTAIIGVLEVLGDGQQKTFSFAGNDPTFMGLPQSDWMKFFDVLKNGAASTEEALQAVHAAMTAIGAATETALQVYTTYDNMMTKKENAELKKYQKNQDKKKKANEKRVKAGLMTEEQAQAEEERMAADLEAKQEEMQIKQAKRQKAMNITSAIINTATGVTKTLAEWGWPLGAIFAAIVGAMGAAQIAMIASTPITTGAEEGGQVIERMQDGKKFNARYSPDKRGFISSPTVLVSENGKEYVVPAAAMDNPSLIPVLNTIEAARRQGTLGSFDFNAVYRQNTPVPGFVSGGPTGDIPSFDTTDTGLSSLDAGTAGKFIAAVDRLCDVLKNPILAYVTMLGENGIVAKMKEYNRTRERGQIGGKKR
ncbi:MAG: phage tail tape measure protein [Alistipes sp. 58_9_plus]|nr:MAG: phage tail tape measure protein [Alistipes sp. 58_9_plus]